MTHEELVDRVADALIAAHFGPGKDLSYLTEQGQWMWQMNARAAIAAVADAIREPTHEMNMASAKATIQNFKSGECLQATEWRAMLAASSLVPKEDGK